MLGLTHYDKPDLLLEQLKNDPKDLEVIVDNFLIIPKDAIKNSAFFEWSIDDVKMRAKDRGVEITDEEAYDILSALYYDHDASLGITWGQIDIQSDISFPEKFVSKEPI